MTRSRHIARDNINGLQIALANWYVDGVTFVETGTGSTASVTASVEYPVGVFTQIKFAGAVTGTIPTLTTLVSDVANVSIPNGANFYIRVWRSNSGGIVFTNVGQDSTNGDLFKYSGVTDLTMGGAFTSSDATNMSFPSAIIAQTVNPSVALIGDSRVSGLNDIFSDNSGDKGELARGIGPNLGYIQMGIPSDQALKFVASHNLRVALGNFCSHIVVNYGINDLSTGGRSDAQIQGDLNTIRGYFPTKKVFLATMPPSTTSSDSWATVANQAVKAFEANRVLNNNWRRTTPAGYAGYFEVANVVETGNNSGFWKVDGTASKYTADGVHESNFAYVAEKNAGVVDPNRLAL